MQLSFLINWLIGFTAVVNIVLGVVVFRKNPHAILNRLFLGFALNACLWSIAVLMVLIKEDYNGLLFWIRISHAVAATTPMFVFALVYCFRDEDKKEYPYVKVAPVLLFSLLLSLASLTPAFIAGVAVPLQNKEPLYGPFFPLYALFFSGITLYAIYMLFRQLRISRGLVRYQIRYFIGGILISFVLGSCANLFLPILGITVLDLRPFGPVFTLVMIMSISYAIVKYRLMDIRMAIRKVLVYSITIFFLAGTYVVIFLLLERYFRLYLEANILPVTLALLILVAIFFQPFKDMFQALVDRFYRGVYDYYDTLIGVNKAMVSILHMNELLNFLVEKVVNTIYLEGAVFFLKEQDGYFTAAAEKKLQYFPSPLVGKLALTNPLVNYLEKKAAVLLQTDLKDLTDAVERKILVGEMKKLHAEVAVPVLMDEKLEAILFLGFKISGEPYSTDDVNLLSALSYQVAVSLKNARLYQEVLEIKQYLENILKNMGNGLIAVDAQGKITTFNSTVERLTGKLAGEVLGKKVQDVLERDLSRQILQTLHNGQHRNEVEVEIPSANSTSFLCCSTALVESLGAGERGAIMVLSDVTRVKELEREKSQSQRLASLGELAAGMAHEIKNPLVSIKTFAELLPEKYEDEEFRYGFSRIVSQEIERINKLVMELLGFSRIHKPAFEQVDIKDIFEEILFLLSPQFHPLKIKVEKYYHRDLPAIRADRDQLKQALLNICLNGIQAMPGGGVLAVEVFPVAENKIKMLIKDTGTGINPEQKERIFDPFFTTKSDGVGIGLSISHKIISEHGGTVQFHSTEKGTTFEINLPAAG